MSRGPRGPGRWGTVAVAAAVATAVPLMGSWAATDQDAPDRPAAPRRADRAPSPATRKARARPHRAADRVALGAYIPGATDHPRRIERFVRKTGRRPAIIMYFRRLRDVRAFDARTLRRVRRAGAVPMITWEPWSQPLRDIARGLHDGYLRSEARAARRWGRLVLVRFAHEMNGDWYPWGVQASTPREYVRAFRRVVTIFRRERAANVRFVWAPNGDTGGDRLIRRLYPGDRWVDWVGFSGYGWGGPWEWLEPIDVYQHMYRTLTDITDKPIVIAETGAGEVGGDKSRWIRRAFGRDLPRLRRVRALIWFDDRDQIADFRIDSTRASLRAFRAAVASPRYAGTAADVKQGGLDR